MSFKRHRNVMKQYRITAIYYGLQLRILGTITKKIKKNQNNRLSYFIEWDHPSGLLLRFVFVIVILLCV